LARGSASVIGSPGVATNGPPAIGAAMTPTPVSALMSASGISVSMPARGNSLRSGKYG
jgi:hypothetical protein